MPAACAARPVGIPIRTPRRPTKHCNFCAHKTLQVLRSALVREREKEECALRLHAATARSECALRHTLAARVRAALRVRNAANVALRERACLWPLEWHVSCCHNCNVDG